MGRYRVKRDTHQHRRDTRGYYAPVSGYYQVTSELIRHVPTGKFQTIPNPEKRWYQFWKPKMITREIMQQVREPGMKQTVYVSKGDMIAPGAKK